MNQLSRDNQRDRGGVGWREGAESGETDRQTDRQTETQRETDREKRTNERKKKKYIYINKGNGISTILFSFFLHPTRERERQRERERVRDRDTETERQRQSQREYTSTLIYTSDHSVKQYRFGGVDVEIWTSRCRWPEHWPVLLDTTDTVICTAKYPSSHHEGTILVLMVDRALSLRLKELAF